MSQDMRIAAANPEIENWFDQVIGIENTGILNGRRYKVEFHSGGSNPFFGSGESRGAVTYNGQTYSVPLLYDIYQDQVVVKHLTKSGAVWFVQLDKRIVTEFVLEGKRFKKYSDRYHQVVFESDRFSLVCKRAKISSVRNGIRNYLEDNQYFLLRPNTKTRFSSVSDFKKLLNQKADKEKFNAFISTENIKARTANDDDLNKVAQFVDNLLQKTQL
jgi:hypothetical protein